LLREAYDGMDRKVHCDRTGDVDVLVTPEPMRVLPNKWQQLYRYFHQTSREYREVEFLRLERRTSFGILFWVASCVKCPNRRVVDGDVVWVPVSADWVGSDHYFRFKLTNNLYHTAGYLVNRSRD
jgi:hypothetical protein